jgi:hypothetical protein
MTMPYRLCTLDVTPTNEINDEWSSSDVLDLGDEPTVHEVCEALKGCERMALDYPEATIVLVEDGGDYLVCDKKTGRKGYRLRKEA